LETSIDCAVLEGKQQPLNQLGMSCFSVAEYLLLLTTLGLRAFEQAGTALIMGTRK